MILPIGGMTVEDAEAIIDFVRATPQPTREEWHAARKSGLGGSDAPIVMLVSPYRDANTIRLWAEKTGRLDPVDLTSDEAEMGLELEPVVLRRLGKKSGRWCALWPQYRSVENPSIPWLRCTPDGVIHDPSWGVGIVQIKTTDSRFSSEWKDGPPIWVQVQVQHEMAACQAAWACVAVLIGRRLEWFDLERNDAFVAKMVQDESRFWDCVLNDVQPELGEYEAATHGESIGRDLARLYRGDGRTVFLPPESDVWHEALARAKTIESAATKDRKKYESLIKAAIGEGTAGITPNGTIYDWQEITRRGYTVEETTYRQLRAIGQMKKGNR